MKRILSILLTFSMLFTSFLLTACQSNTAGGGKTENTETLPEEETPALEEAVPTTVEIIQNGEMAYEIVRSDYLDSDAPETRGALSLSKTIESVYGIKAKMTTDWIARDSDPDSMNDVYEILVGHTNRNETAAAIEGLASDEYTIRVMDKKIVICGYDDNLTRHAVNDFIKEYVVAENTSLSLPIDLNVVSKAQYSDSVENGASYVEMGDLVLSAFVRDYYGGGSLPNTEFWDAAEILEAFIDAYEQTRNEEYLSFIESIVKRKFYAERKTVSWASNKYNDDVAWGCIAFARMHLLTKDTDNFNENYLAVSQQNFDMMYDRAISDDLGGALFWNTDNETKNSCVNCPASIAACLLAQATGDDSYYEKAKALMDWEFQNMFNSKTGAVYDSYNLSGKKNNWASSYNQGTFIGACTLLHEKYGDEIYLTNAQLAAQYAMNQLGNVGGVLNGESNTGDLIGFKGILTRWLYRFGGHLHDTGKTDESMEILNWLQHNADTAFKNRNDKDLIWTDWAQKTPKDVSDLDIFGFSPAIALLFNCEPWD